MSRTIVLLGGCSGAGKSTIARGVCIVTEYMPHEHDGRTYWYMGCESFVSPGRYHAVRGGRPLRCGGFDNWTQNAPDVLPAFLARFPHKNVLIEGFSTLFTRRCMAHLDDLPDTELRLVVAGVSQDAWKQRMAARYGNDEGRWAHSHYTDDFLTAAALLERPKLVEDAVLLDNETEHDLIRNVLFVRRLLLT